MVPQQKINTERDCETRGAVLTYPRLSVVPQQKINTERDCEIGGRVLTYPRLQWFHNKRLTQNVTVRQEEEY